MSYPEGVDVSGYQPEKFEIKGKDFVFLKVTEGTNYTNPRWKAQRDWARSHGLCVFYYHFARGLKNHAEADHFLKVLGPIAAGEAVAFDWEDSDVSDQEKHDWIAYVNSKLGPNHRVGLYCNLDYWKHRDKNSYAGEFLWIADPSAAKGQPRIQHPWTFHQYSNSGGKLDLNVANFKDKAALRAWAGYATTPPPKPTIPVFDPKTAKVGQIVRIGNIELKVTKIN